MTIDKFGEFIYKNKHLPGFMSANDIEENGNEIDLVERQNQLHELLEIYGLYIIELKSQNDKLTKRIACLEKQ